MRNVEMKITGSNLIITIDLKKDFGRSKSNKSVIIASTDGNKELPNSDGIYIGLNVYKKIT